MPQKKEGMLRNATLWSPRQVKKYFSILLLLDMFCVLNKYGMGKSGNIGGKMCIESIWAFFQARSLIPHVSLILIHNGFSCLAKVYFFKVLIRGLHPLSNCISPLVLTILISYHLPYKDLCKETKAKKIDKIEHLYTGTNVSHFPVN